MNAVTRIDHPTTVKLTVRDFDLLCESGAFRDYHRTELIDGAIVAMNAQYRPHLFAKSRLALRLGKALEALGSDLEAVTEGSLALQPVDEPQPDIALTRAALAEGALPADTVALIVEVADTTLQFDLTVKAALYARHAIPEYWVVDVRDRKIRQFWAPAQDSYAEERTVAFGAEIASATIAGLKVSTHDLG